MRIQETDRILKESRYARNAAARTESEGVVSRMWRALSTKLTALFHKHEH